MAAADQGLSYWFSDNAPKDHPEEVIDYEEVLKLRSALGCLRPEILQKSRSATNIYEDIGRAGFVCRSALKLANLEYAANFCQGVEKFADLCAAPGGFSEYLLWKQPNSHGYAISSEVIRMQFHDKALEFTYADIYRSDEVNTFVKKSFPVDLVVADGGFQACRDQPDQDIQLAPLALRETAIGLRLLRKNGSFIIKLFLPLSSPATRAIIGIAYTSFHKIVLIKPLASRPASGEVYLVALHCEAPLALREQYAATLSSVIAEDNLSIPDNVALSSFYTQLSPLFHDTLRQARSAFLVSQARACHAILTHAAHAAATDDEAYGSQGNQVLMTSSIFKQQQFAPAPPSPSYLLDLWGISARSALPSSEDDATGLPFFLKSRKRKRRKRR